MKAKYELKMKMNQLGRAVEECKRLSKSYERCTTLFGKTKGTSCHKRTFNLMDKSRESLWKALDKKVELEQDIKRLEKIVIEQIMKEINND